MIRKIIIVALTLGAVGTAVAFSLTRHEALVFSTKRVSAGAIHCCVVITVATSTRPLRTGWWLAETDEPRWSYRPHILHVLGSRFILVPFWQVFVAFAAYPTIAFIRGPLRRYRRRKRGLCVTCGYDLRGSPERCPECGMEQVAR